MLKKFGKDQREAMAALRHSVNHPVTDVYLGATNAIMELNPAIEDISAALANLVKFKKIKDDVAPQDHILSINIFDQIKKYRKLFSPIMLIEFLEAAIIMLPQGKSGFTYIAGMPEEELLDEVKQAGSVLSPDDGLRLIRAFKPFLKSTNSIVKSFLYPNYKKLTSNSDYKKETENSIMFIDSKEALLEAMRVCSNPGIMYRSLSGNQTLSPGRIKAMFPELAALNISIAEEASDVESLQALIDGLTEFVNDPSVDNRIYVANQLGDALKKHFRPSMFAKKKANRIEEQVVALLETMLNEDESVSEVAKRWLKSLRTNLGKGPF
jgi:hypothetical protein